MAPVRTDSAPEVRAAETAGPSSCYHCGLPASPDSPYRADIEGISRLMCCPGCQAVALAIVDGGLESYYRHRTEAAAGSGATSLGITPELERELALYDLPNVQRDFVAQLDDERQQATLVIEGITCAACVWLLEHHLERLPGVLSVSVNLSNHRAQLAWNPEQAKLSELIGNIYRIGYQAHPYHPDREEQLLQREQRVAVRRLAVAAAGTGLIMTFATALYAGAMQGIDDSHRAFIRWVSLLVATPVMLYAARPFFQAAWRDLRTRHLSMDVPVSLAIGGAFLASAWATASGGGEVYFDSVCMFTFFLLLGRYLEMRARHRTGRAGNSLLGLLPASATLVKDGQELLVSARDLQPGDLVRLLPGQTVPADGVLVEGISSLDESALTGEYLPVTKAAGDTLVGGTINVENPLLMKITDVGANTQLSAIVRLLDRAHQDKPRAAILADRIAAYFVGAVLVVATLVSGYWYLNAPEHALWITLSVLVVTCPCALSLATPTALTAATGALHQRGLLITRGHVLESLAKATHIVFDKTGTLTEGNLELRETRPLADLDRDHCLALAAALEAHSEHPVARAFDGHAAAPARQVTNVLGQGIEGQIGERRYRIGKPGYAFALCDALKPPPLSPSTQGQWLLLCDEQQPLAWFRLDDRLRKEALSAVTALQQAGLEVQLLTGDSSSAPLHVSRQLGIDQLVQDASPEQKLAHIRQMQAQGARILMVGDGINDIPVLAGAQTSIAMGKASDLAKTNADAVLLSNDLLEIPRALVQARRTRRIIFQNLSWALAYNLVALPLAAAGLIAPWMAAIGMSASSLVVVVNALRLTHTGPVPATTPRAAQGNSNQLEVSA